MNWDNLKVVWRSQVGSWREKNSGNLPWPECGRVEAAEASQPQQAHKGVGSNVRETRKADPGETCVDLQMAEACKSSLVVFPSLSCIMVKCPMAQDNQLCL